MSDITAPPFDHAAPDLTDCDREPIHIPGSIQPHGLLLVVERNSLALAYAAGPVEAALGRDDWRGASLGELLDDALAGRIARLADSTAVGAYIGAYLFPQWRYLGFTLPAGIALLSAALVWLRHR